MLGRTLGWSTVTAILLLPACGPGMKQNPPESSVSADTENPTVRVKNQGLSTVAIYEVGEPGRIGTVLPGHTACLEMTVATDQKKLVARPVGGGTEAVSPSFDTRPGEGWKWSLTTTPILDGISLERAAPCSPRPARKAGG